MDAFQKFPPAYFITISTYGTWLPGDSRGSVDRKSSFFGTDSRPARPALEQASRDAMKSTPVTFNQDARRVVLGSFIEVAEFRGWRLWAAHVRTEHVHIVIEAAADEDKVLRDLKARATRLLREAELVSPDQPVWVHHGSTRKLWKAEDVEAAVIYTLEEQGTPMAWYDGRKGKAV